MHIQVDAEDFDAESLPAADEDAEALASLVNNNTDNNQDNNNSVAAEGELEGGGGGGGSKKGEKNSYWVWETEATIKQKIHVYPSYPHPRVGFFRLQPDFTIQMSFRKQ